MFEPVYKVHLVITTTSTGFAFGQIFGGKPLGENLWGKPLGENEEEEEEVLEPKCLDSPLSSQLQIRFPNPN